jgi:hypothetical protein
MNNQDRIVIVTSCVLSGGIENPLTSFVYLLCCAAAWCIIDLGCHLLYLYRLPATTEEMRKWQEEEDEQDRNNSDNSDKEN